MTRLEGAMQRGENPSLAVKQEAKAIATRLREQAPHEAVNAHRSLLAFKRDSQLYDAAVNDKSANLFQEIEGDMVGSTSRRRGSLNSVDVNQKVVSNEYVSNIIREVEDVDHKGIGKRYTNRPFGEDVARVMAGEKVLDPDAIHFAKVFEKWKEDLRLRANNAGAMISKLPGHITTQYHNSLKLLKAGKEEWKKAILPLLDHQRTFGAADPAQFLDRVYDNIVIGRHSAANTSEGGLAGVLSRARVLHFKNADAFIAYNKQFGDRDIISSLFNGIVKLAEDTVLMERMGPDPDGHFSRLMAKYGDALRAEGRPKSKIMRLGMGPEAALRNRFDQLTRASSVPVSPHLAYWMQGLRNLNNLTQMGQVLLSSLPDIAGRAANAHLNGIGFLSGYHRLFKEFASGPLTREKKEQFRLLGVYFNGLLNDTASRIMPVDGVPGTLSKWSNTMFKYNLLNWWTDRMDGGHAWMLSDNLAKHSNVAFDFLPEKLRGVLELYGIGEKDWAVMRKGVVEFSDGARLITADGVRANGGDNAIAQKLGAYFIGETDTAVPKPGARERAIALQGLRAGTPVGEAMRMVAQYKMFAITMLTKVWPRVMADGMPGALHLAAMMGLFGYGAMTAKDLVRGKGPRDPLDKKTWTQAMLAGGGLGILGDVLLNDYREYGNSLASVIAGPSFARAEDVLNLIPGTASAIAGGSREKRKLAAQTFKTVMQQVPFTNMFYTRAALDYLWTYQMQELMNPGYLRRMERRIIGSGRQDFLVRPSDIVDTGGGFR